MKTDNQRQNSAWIHSTLLLGLPVALLLLGGAATQLPAAPGDVDPTFDPGPGPNDAVAAVAVQPDGKVVIGGWFTQVNGLGPANLARLNRDGSRDGGFLNGMAGVNRLVQGVVCQPNGQVLIHGEFTSVNGTPRTNLARLEADGRLDLGFAPTFINRYPFTPPETIGSFAFQPDGRLVVGGSFTNVNGVSRTNVARLNADGTLDHTFLNGLEGVNGYQVLCLALQADSNILVGGEFTQVNGVARTNLARLHADGSLDVSFQASFGNPWDRVECLALQPDGKIMIAGRFTSVGGLNRVNLARLNPDGSADPSFGQVWLGPDWGSTSSTALVVQPNGKILYGGYVQGLYPAAIFSRRNADGSSDSSFDVHLTGSVYPEPGPAVWAAALQADGHILVAGIFTTVNQFARSHVVRLMGEYPPLEIITRPQSITVEIGSTAEFHVRAAGNALAYQWLFNDSAINSATTPRLQLAGVTLLDAGSYSVVVTNATGAVTSAPAMLSVIPPVERRQVPALRVTGQAGDVVGLDYRESLSAGVAWETMGTMSLNTTSQYYFDLSVPLPAQRFYRAWEAGAPSVPPGLGPFFLAPALTLTGSPGNSIRVDGINQFGPTDAWFTLDTVTLTNATQLYFDVSASTQPPRLYRLVPVP